MSIYHIEVINISRLKKKENSIAKVFCYISGRKLRDSYKGKTYSHKRSDVEFFKIFLPTNVPPEFDDLQILCNMINNSEKRYDARTGKHFICSLPNELSLDEQIKIVREFVEKNFISTNLCAIVAIHSGTNKYDPSKNNPHAHIIVSTRTIDSKGFNSLKHREHNNKKYIYIWREEWANTLNKAYERNKSDIRVSHQSLEVQGIDDREPICHLSQEDLQKEQRGEHTEAGNKKRAIEKRNREIQLAKEQKYELESELSH